MACIVLVKLQVNLGFKSFCYKSLTGFMFYESEFHLDVDRQEVFVCGSGQVWKTRKMFCLSLVFFLIMPLKSKVKQNVFICIGE